MFGSCLCFKKIFFQVRQYLFVCQLPLLTPLMLEFTLAVTYYHIAQCLEYAHVQVIIWVGQKVHSNFSITSYR